MKKYALLTLLVGMFTVPCSAQGMTVPNITFVAGTALDNLSTYRFLTTTRMHEINPVAAPLQDHPKGLLLAATGVDAVTLLIGNKLHRNHPKVAATMVMVLGLVRLSAGIHNLSMIEGTK